MKKLYITTLSLIFILTLILNYDKRATAVEIKENIPVPHVIEIKEEKPAFNYEFLEEQREIISNITDVIEIDTMFYDVPLSEDLQNHIFIVAGELELDEKLVIAVIQKESLFDIDCLGDNGDSIGLMQVQPKWWQHLADSLGVSIYEPYGNITVGCHIIKYYLDNNDGDVLLALTQYNTGSNTFINKYAYDVVEIAESIR